MNKKEYRKRKAVYKIAKRDKISVSKANKQYEAFQKCASLLGPLTQRQRMKVIRVVEILLEIK